MIDVRVVSALTVAALAGHAIASDPWAEPAGFYNGATGTGPTLKSQLSSIMTSGHIQRTYGAFRNSARLHDVDPSDANRVILAYNRASVVGQWDNGVTWNREHVWPQSLQPGSASNSSTGNLGDPHALRPCNPSINSSRGNKPFGWDDSSGTYGSLGANYFPGDADIGDIARSLMYSDTRWGSSLGISLTDGTPSGNQMGDLSSLVAWHFRDTPDEFERRRNHVIYSSAENPIWYTNNRNAFVDRPEFVWSVYKGQSNDTQLSVSVPDADGLSFLAVDLDPVFVGATPGSESVSLAKTGLDGTYFEVVTTGDAESDVTGRHNAFPITLVPITSTPISVTIGSASTAGAKSGEVFIDNLDVTSGAGNGMAAQDADDIISVTLDVLDHAEGSFDAAADINTLAIEFGAVPLGVPATITFDVHNLESTPGFTGSLWISPGAASGDAELSIDLTGALIEAGASESITATLDTSALGAFGATIEIVASDDPAVAGALADEPLVITLSGTVGDGCPADLDGNGALNVDDIDLFVTAFLAADPAADCDGSGTLNVDDIDCFVASFLAGCP